MQNIIKYGTTEYHFKDETLMRRHRIGAPAVITDSVQEWYKDGVFHRDNGPARVYLKTKKIEFWIEGRYITTMEDCDPELFETYIWREE
jgi:hypothetical protein